MIFLGNASSEGIRAAMRAGELGMLATPAEGRSPAPYRVWAADNGAFGKGYPGDAAYLDWLARWWEHRRRCLFATAPDVVADAVATLERSAPMLPLIRDLEYPAALVAQDGLEHLDVPWSTFDVLFIGGTTEWKLGLAAASLCREAKARGKRVHVGRVNSARRWLRFLELGAVDSADGTTFTRGPRANLARVRRWRPATADVQSVLELVAI